MNWIKKQNLLAIETIQFNRQPYIEIEDLWNALYLIFNSAQSHQVNDSLLEDLLSKQHLPWNSFSRKEFTIAINKCNDLSASGTDRISWKHLK